MRERAHGEQGTRKAGALEITPFQPALLNSSTSQGRRGSKGTRNTLKQELKLTAAPSAAKSLSPDSGTILQQASPIRPTSTVTTRDTRILPRPELVKCMGCTRRACPPKPSARASVSLGVEAACSLTGERAHTHTRAHPPQTRTVSWSVHCHPPVGTVTQTWGAASLDLLRHQVRGSAHPSCPGTRHEVGDFQAL